MLNAANKLVIKSAIFIIAITSCTNSSTTDNGIVSADSLYNRAKTAINLGQFQKAIELLDSIDIKYPEATDVRRKAMRIKPKAIEELAKLEYTEADSMIAVLQFRQDSIKKAFNDEKATATQYANVSKELREWQHKIEKINHKLTVSRNQQARLNDSIWND